MLSVFYPWFLLFFIISINDYSYNINSLQPEIFLSPDTEQQWISTYSNLTKTAKGLGFWHYTNTCHKLCWNSPRHIWTYQSWNWRGNVIYVIWCVYHTRLLPGNKQYNCFLKQNAEYLRRNSFAKLPECCCR